MLQPTDLTLQKWRIVNLECISNLEMERFPFSVFLMRSTMKIKTDLRVLIQILDIQCNAAIFKQFKRQFLSSILGIS